MAYSHHQMEDDMNFRDARDLAAEYGAELPKFDHTHPLAGCWIDRIAMLPMADERGYLKEWIMEANSYSGN